MVFVNVDLAMLSRCAAACFATLKQKYGNEYTAKNVAICIPQHSGPGGYSLHALYNFTTLGFDKKILDHLSEVLKPFHRLMIIYNPRPYVLRKAIYSREVNAPWRLFT